MHNSKAHIWFIAPAIILMIIILIFPLFLAGGISFTDYNLGNKTFEWVGLENYDKMFNRKTYVKMIWATATYVIVVVPISVVLGLCAAMLLNSLRFGADIYKTIFFLPVMATLLAMAIAWEFTLHPTLGIVNSFLANGCGGVREFILDTHTSSCALSPWCAAYIQGVQLVLRLPWGQLVLLPLPRRHDRVRLFVAVHVSTHTSSCVLSP